MTEVKSEEYLDRLVSELQQTGVNLSTNNIQVNRKDSPEDFELRTILDMQERIGKKYSSEQMDILRHHGDACILACAGSGKALINSTPVMVENGVTCIGMLNVGDKVYDANGKLQTVEAIYPQGKKRVYDITFSNNTVVSCCEDHLWKITGGGYTRSVVKSTKDIIKKFYNKNKGIKIEVNSREHTNSVYNLFPFKLRVPYVKPIEKPRAKLTIDPYILGVFCNSMFCYSLTVNNNFDIVRFDKAMNKLHVRYYIEMLSSRFRNITIINPGAVIKAINDQFDDFKIDNEKLVTSIISNCSIKQRSDFIDGVLHSYGYISNKGYILSIDSPDVNFGVLDVLTRTGYIVCKYNEHAYYVEKILNNNYSIGISSITETDLFEPMTCITVSGKAGLFTLGNGIVTHNTTISTHLIVKRILTGEIADTSKLIFTTYSKAGTTEMQERLNKLLKKMNINKTVEVRTLHSFFLSILRSFGTTAGIISAADRSKYIRQACKDADYALKNDDLMTVDNLLSYQVNYLLSDQRTIDACVNTLDDLKLEQYSKIRQGYAKRKADAGVIDYDDMQSYLYLWLVKWGKSEVEQERATAEAVRNYCKAMWTDFYIDEAQDTSRIQFSIIRAMVSDPNNKNKLDRHLTFIGDDDQAIYQWRGSDPSIILSIGALFNMPTFVLSTNYRCKSAVVDYATAGVKCNSNRYNKGMQSYKDGGSVRILQSTKLDLYSLSELAMKQIKKWIADGSPLDSIAVLSRNNFHLALLNNMLLKDGIYCKTSEDMKFTKSYLYKDIKMLMNMCEPTWDKNVTQAMLWKLCRFLNMNNAAAIAEFQDNNGLSLEDTLGYIVKNYISSDIGFDKQLRLTVQAKQKIEYYVNKLTYNTQTDIATLYRVLTSGTKDEKLEALTFMYYQSTEYMYKTMDKKRSVKGIIEYIKTFVDTEGFDKMSEFFRVTEQLESGSMVIPGDKVTLSTVHSAKGREWKNVIMFASDNVSEPSLDSVAAMLHDNMQVHDIFSYIDEERRLFYVGNTRAKENLLVITYKEPSVFILESLGIIPADGHNNESIVQFSQDKSWFDRYRHEVETMLEDKDNKYYFDMDTLETT